MDSEKFPLEKIFGSRTRVKIITLFTTGVKRPYFVREIARTVNERLNAVRRELGILEHIGMLNTYDDRRRKYYVADERFPLYQELASIMQKAGPGIEDVLFKHIESIGDLQYVCLTGFFTGASSAPTDMLLVGKLYEKRLEVFAKQLESQVNREISYTPMTVNEYRYRLGFNDLFLRQIFLGSYKELVNRLPSDLQPKDISTRKPTSIIRNGAVEGR